MIKCKIPDVTIRDRPIQKVGVNVDDLKDEHPRPEGGPHCADRDYGRRGAGAHYTAAIPIPRSRHNLYTVGRE
jgi:hypothetical protein